MKILIIDDEEGTAKIEAALEGQGHDLTAAGSVAAASALLDEHEFDAVFFDYGHNPGGATGVAGLAELLKLRPRLLVAVSTSHASIESAVESMRLGAADYLPKPFTRDQLRRVTNRIARGRQVAHESGPAGHGSTAMEIQVGTRVTLEELEHAHIRRILSQVSSMDEAAQVLGIDPATLYRKRKRFGL